jgi:pseudouridine kinase
VDTGAVAANAGQVTAEYAAILQPDNNLAFGIADMAVFETLTPARLESDWPLLAAADWVFADCNLPAATLRALIGRAAADGVKLAIDAVSVHKVTRLPDDLSGVAALFLNRDEAAAYLAAEAPPAGLFVRLAARGPDALVLTLGAQGLLVSQGTGLRAMPAFEANVRDVTGAGDSLVAGTLFGLLGGRPLGEAARLGLRLAKLTVESEASVRRDLTSAMLEGAP